MVWKPIKLSRQKYASGVFSPLQVSILLADQFALPTLRTVPHMWGVKFNNSITPRWGYVIIAARRPDSAFM